MLQGVAAIRENNFNMISQMFKILEEEEASDNQMRAQFQQKWARLPSSALTVNFRQQLHDFQQKAQIALDTDKRTEEKFAVHGDSLKLLNKTKNELASLIP